MLTAYLRKGKLQRKVLILMVSTRKRESTHTNTLCAQEFVRMNALMMVILDDVVSLDILCVTK